jgi:hypothetical protein
LIKNKNESSLEKLEIKRRIVKKKYENQYESDRAKAHEEKERIKLGENEARKIR